MEAGGPFLLVRPEQVADEKFPVFILDEVNGHSDFRGFE
jgi:hypothetical protein